MNKEISVALLISTYNWPEALDAVFKSVLSQTRLPDEILIADDGSDTATEDLVNRYKKRFTIPLKHFWQPNSGFQKSSILNKAVAGTNCDYIIEIDGDIVLNKNFIRDHMQVAEKGYYIRGSRLLINEQKSKEILNNGSIKNLSSFSRGVKNRFNGLRLPLLSLLFIKKSDRSRNFRGCNCAFWKEDFIKVNGYNNEINGWGHEDIELAARFINAGVLQKKVKMMAVCYHIYHKITDKKHESRNFIIYTKTLKQGIRICAKGYHTY